MTIRTVDALTLKRWLDVCEAVVVDVREPAEYASEHIRGATSIPLGKIHHGLLPELSGRKLVIHCRKGGRGQSACEKLRNEMQDMDVYNLAGGIEMWEKAGLPLEKVEKRMLPLDRQVQLTVGLVVLAASLLGYFVSTLFILLTGAIGVGLTFAGLTGFCGLARLLAWMPWNKVARG